jgi:hypothetical protein
VAARIGRAISTFKAYRGTSASKLLWWTNGDSNGERGGFDSVSSADFENSTAYHTKDVVGTEWHNQSYLQLLLAPHAGIDLSAILDPDIGNNDDSSSGKSDYANASGRTSAVDPDQLSRIDEGDEDDEPPDWFTTDIWHTCSPEEKQMIKEVEAEAADPEIELESDDGLRPGREDFIDSGGKEIWNATNIHSPSRGNVIAITWPDRDESGNSYVSIEFPGDAAKLIAMAPVPEKHRAEIRAYLKTNASQIFIEVEDEPVVDGGKSYDDLTSSDYKEFADQVGTAVSEELKTWIDHD